MVRRLLRRRHRRRLVGRARAYDRLAVVGELGRVRGVRALMMNTRLSETPGWAGRLGGGINDGTAELATRQFLNVRLGGSRLNKALLDSLASGLPLIYPLPRVWQRAVEQQGFAVARWSCTASWGGFLLLAWGYGVWTALRTVASDLRRTSVRPPRPPYAYFDRLTNANLPRASADGRSFDILSWYAAWPGRHPAVTEAVHSVRDEVTAPVGALRVRYAPSAVPGPPRTSAVARFAARSAAAAVRALATALTGRWAGALMLAESVMGERTALAEPDDLAREYLFHNSVHVYRPLWTYVAERRGCSIVFYFYSLSEQFLLPSGYADDRDEWGAMSWPRYLVWDQGQAELVRRAVGDTPSVQVVGPIAFEDRHQPLQTVREPAVAVFDVQPHRRSLHFGFSTMNDLYPRHHHIACRFNEEVLDAAQAAGFAVLHKRKRSVGAWVHPKYSRTIDRLAERGGFVEVDPGVAAVRIIEQSSAVISAPFTSTGVLAKSVGKPSVFYDPLGVIDPDDRGRHDVPILRGRQELAEWLSMIDTARNSTPPRE